MHIRVSSCVAALAVIAFALPVWAYSKTTPLTIDQPATIGTTSLRPGNYMLTADTDTNEVMVKRDGKLVATVPTKKVTLDKKPVNTAVLFNGRQIQEIQFAGKAEAVEIE